MLYEGWRLTKRGKSGRANQQRYSLYLERNLFNLKKRLEERTYQPAKFRIRIIKQPKLRRCQVPSLEDKIVQHVICDNYVYNAFEKPLIKETAACLKGRGTDYARLLLAAQLKEFWDKKHTYPYILKLDIKSYFATIPHERCKELFDRYIEDEDVKFYLNKFLDSTSIGLPLGLQQSQLTANLYLSEMDHMVKQKFHYCWYGRYMDDFYIISDDIEFLEYLWKELEKYLKTIGLMLNPKTAITYNKVEFLGFNFFINKNGKVIRTLAKGKKTTQLHNLRRLADELGREEKTPEKVAESYFGWRQYAKKGNTRKCLLKFDEKFRNRFNQYGYNLIISDKGKVSIVELE